MKCPNCGEDNNVVLDSRERTNFHRRIRQCVECGHRFFTREEVVDTGYHVIERPAPNWVKDQRRNKAPDWRTIQESRDKKMRQIEELIKAELK